MLICEKETIKEFDTASILTTIENDRKSIMNYIVFLSQSKIYNYDITRNKITFMNSVNKMKSKVENLSKYSTIIISIFF